MKDRDRLLDGNSTELERLLLSAVAKERPSGALLRRMRAGIGVAGSVVTFKAALAAASVTIVAAATTVAVLGQPPDVTPTVGAPSKVDAPAQPKAVIPADEPPQLSQQSPEPRLEPVPAPAAKVQGQHASSPRATPSSASTGGDIREQMQLIEQARASLRSGDAQAALARVSEYQQRYPRGIFGQEASVLNVEAFHRAGDRTRARALAEGFVRRHPGSPHVERLSHILGSDKAER